LTGRRLLPFWLLLCCGAGLLSGCGAVGEPLPPLRNIPERTHDLRARQVENQLLIEWTWPLLSTEGVALKNLARFEVYALEIPEAGEVPSLDVFERESREIFVVQEGALASHGAGEKIVQTVSATGLQGKTLVLGVRGEGANGRQAGFSNLFVIEVGSAPERVTGLEARVDPSGVTLAWTPAKGAGLYRVTRAAAADGPFQEIGSAESTEFRDSAALWNTPQWYRVRGVGKTRTGEIEGPASRVVEVVARDLFPPGRPTGLRAIIGLTSVELVWDYSSDPDVAGYRVLRGEDADRIEPLAATLVQLANYSDADVLPGRTYYYAISAVDHEGNASDSSGVVAVTLP